MPFNALVPARPTIPVGSSMHDDETTPHCRPRAIADYVIVDYSGNPVDHASCVSVTEGV